MNKQQIAAVIIDCLRFIHQFNNVGSPLPTPPKQLTLSAYNSLSHDKKQIYDDAHDLSNSMDGVNYK